MSGIKYLTSTQVKYLRTDQTDLASEVKPFNPDFFTPYNTGSPEPRLLQLKYDESEGPTKADNGELDQVVVYREHDTGNGKKFHGWTNPLGWTDAGEADETVL